MIKFSVKNKMPKAMTPTSLDDILEGLDGLRSISRELYKPVVTTLLDAVIEFFIQFRQNSSVSDASTLVELSFWIGDQRTWRYSRLVGNRSQSP